MEARDRLVPVQRRPGGRVRHARVAAAAAGNLAGTPARGCGGGRHRQPAPARADLGRPERFLNMLRVVKPTSPMSVGSWLLAVGPRHRAGDLRRSSGGLPPAAEAVAGVLGPALATYTGGAARRHGHPGLARGPSSCRSCSPRRRDQRRRRRDACRGRARDRPGAGGWPCSRRVSRAGRDEHHGAPPGGAG